MGVRHAAAAVAFVALAHCERPAAPEHHDIDAGRPSQPSTPSGSASSTAPSAHAADASAADAAPRTGPTGTIEGTVSIDGPIVGGPPLAVPSTYRTHPGCRDAALRYAQPFDITQPGPFPGALVAAEARELAPGIAHDVRITFRDCDIEPRVVFATSRDHIYMHLDSRQTPLPHVVGAGMTLDRLLIPGQADIELHVTPGQYPVQVRNYPEWVLGTLLVLGNRFIDTTDTAGHFRLTDVPIGNVMVHTWYPGVTEAHRMVTVRANEVSHVDLRVRQMPMQRDGGPPVDAGQVPP